MAALSFLLLLLHLIVALLFTSAASRRSSTIQPDSFLTPANPDSSYLLSPSGIFTFGFYPRDGGGYSVGVFMVGIPQKTVVWTADRDGPPVPRNSTLRLASGSLVLQSTERKVITSSTEMAVSGSMLDTGNFVLYNSQENITWQSFDHPTDTILGGQHLSTWDQLVSSASESDPSTGKFRIRMQEDGNLVMFPTNTPNITAYDYWNSGTSILVDTVSLNLTVDGFLYLFINGRDQYLKNFTSRGHTASDIVYRARLDPNGMFRLSSYNTTQKGTWSKVWSATDNECRPMGLCGFNGFCVSIDGAGKCTCLPGFDFVHAGNETSGCERSFVAPSCKGTAGAAADFNVEVVPNFSLDDNTYAEVAVQSQEECQTECLQECNCEAAIYQSGLCRKQRIPIRYGRRNLETSDALIVKVGRGRLAPGTRPDRQIRMDVLVASLCFLALAAVIIIVFAMLLYRNRALLYGIVPRDSGNGGMIEDVAPRSFTYDELSKVTRDFSEEIGRGSFGVVYRGTTSNGRAVAVKKLLGLSADGEREFQAEMKTIAMTHHRNLVRLLGYSVDGSNRLLVYEYMSNGSLADLLFTPEKKQRLLRWEVKMGIVRNIARGLLYLHEECETQIIHCDIKPANILIDECHCAKISDFGLSKLLKPDQTNTFTNIRGTRGYVAPEWHKNLPVTTKADVYSFGIMLLEVVCSRKNMDQSLPEEEIILEQWVYDCFQAGELNRLVDEEEGAVDKRQLERMVKVALWCTMEEPSLRPSTRKVLLMLEGTIDIPAPPCPTSFISCI